MNISPNVNLERFEEADHKLQFQLNKCLNEKRRRESTHDYLEELAGYISASASDMCSLSANPDKCAILQETVNQIRQIKLAEDCNSGDDLQKSEVSSSNPTFLGSDLIAPFLLHALDGFLFVVNTDGKIEFVSHNVESFLKYNHENLIDKSIYNIIHVGDHARFSSNLLPMSIGNVFGWSEPRETVSKSSAFHCRFLIKPPEDQDETMEEKQTRVSQYETMQISAVLLPHAEKNETDEIQTEGQNRLVCVARRLPASEKGNVQGTEQFVTRLDVRGKIISIDTSCVSAVYSQYLNKDLVGCIIQEMCHPDDFQKLTQHLKETLQQGSNTSGVYRLRLAHEKIVYVQTKSKRLNYNPMASEQEIIVANHTILRDSDHCLENSVVVPQRSNPSPASGSIVPSLGSNMNGNSYSFSSLSPQDFNLNDIGLDFLPSSSWDMSGGEGQDLDTSNLPTTLGGPSTPASISSVNSTAQPQRTQHPSGSAFSPELLSGRGSPSTQSPAQVSATGSPAPGRVTPFSNSFPFSPVSSQTVSRTSSPAPNLIKREEPTAQNNDTSLSPMSGLMVEGQNSATNATQKLRNLLTHGIEEADSSVPKNSTSDKMEDMTGNAENGFVNHNSGESVSSHNENIILRELLNQEDDDMNEEGSKNLSCDSNCNVSIASELCSYDALQKRTLNNNNMLRKLLNNDEDKSFKKNQDLLIQQLLKTDGKVSVDMNNLPPGTPKLGGPSRLPNVTMENMNSVAKRKSPDTPIEDSVAKRPAQQNLQHAHLAGQNPMLASMLAQTPRTAPSVPTSIANAIVSQLPQERLPKNLEKKLVHTPYTGAPVSGTNSVTVSQYNFSQVQIGARSLLSTSLQQEVVTADSRGHVTLAPQNTNASGYNQVTNFMNRMLSPGDSNQNVQLGNYGDLLSNNSQQQAAAVQNTANLLIDGLAEASRDPNNVVSANDPLLSDILDQVWSMEQDMNMATDDFAFFKLLEELPEAPATTAPAASPRPPSVHDVQEKLAIQSIQKQLMSFEVQPGPVSTSRNSPRFPQPGVMTQSSLPLSSYSSVNQYQTAPPAYSTSNPTQRARAPGMPTVQTNTLNMTSQQMQQMAQMNSQRQALPQYGGLNNVNDLTPPMRRQLLEQQRHKLFLQQQFNQKKQLLLQQKQQQQQLALNTLNSRQTMPESIPNLQSPASSPYGENMNDLINNTVAPNVTLQRSTSMPEPQLSPRYSNVQQMPNSVAPPASPSQLSPGQRQQPPFSPLSQPGYPNNYPQSRLSPHMQSQPGPTQAWVQRASQNQANLQQQNPMLNAQLSQQASFANQARFSNQQQQQQQQQQPRQMIHSMPSPGARNSPYSNPPDSPFHPPSPGVSLYQQQTPGLPPQAQQPQQRLQRAVSIPNRVNSPRGLPAGFTGGDPILSPQPSPGNYNPPASNFNPTMPVSTSSNYNLDNFSYDQQVYPAAMIDRNRGNGGGAIRSEYVRQELRAKVGARTQQHQVHQQLVQQMPQATGSQSTNQSISQTDFDALGFSLDLDNDGQPSSPALYPQSLLNSINATNSSDNQARTGSPRFQMEEQRPTEQKKSLLQQLLSEPP
ncbi:nuclear receptor coactivator 2 [Trichonephila inaurata madagascariensis]|uniref:Nuclear receptor coactivator 2 n=1 Tax=Trichonephila inaurata madagascariensis TaxID=2747483 RepID=A0A8X6XNP4_9ARAC|nr:nuclear receptor coactivator 2 [Trichonephila inaurata madagascariensis]